MFFKPKFFQKIFNLTMKLKKLDVLILGLNYDQLNYIKIIKQRGFNIFGVDKNLMHPE